MKLDEICCESHVTIMDKVDRKTDPRRSARHSQKKVFAIDLRPREALKRKREIPVVKTTESNTDEGSPDKFAKLQMEKDGEDKHENGDQANTVEMDMNGDEDHNESMSSDDESENSKPLTSEEIVIRTLRVGNLETEEMKAFLRRRDTHQKLQAPDVSNLTGCGDGVHVSHNISRGSSKDDSTSVSASQLPSRTDILTVRSSIREYRNKMEEKAKGISNADLQDRNKYIYLKSHTAHTSKTNNLPAEKLFVKRTNTELVKQVVTKRSLTSSSQEDSRGLCKWLQWAVFLLASLSLGLLAYQQFPSLSGTTEHQNIRIYSATFETHLSVLKPLYPNQRRELWKRAEIHIKRHLNRTNPTEPVSLILTAGHDAEKTLGCLAQQLATAFSSTLNSTVLSIYGTSKSAQDSDQVKLDIDTALKTAFDGGTHAAVIHHFEELPPASTLIFYRYCDHENAAFKKVFLAFTVMLPVAGLDFKIHLTEVEQQVQEYLKDRFVSSVKTVGFNQMDVDKLSGLWSRISHLVLPVAAEQTIELNGCGESGL